MKLLFLLVLSAFCTVTISGQIKYENPNDILDAPKCKPSEVYLKKKVKALLAKQYKDYPDFAVDFTSFKGQDGYNDKVDPKKIIYPYKIEVFVYVKRKVMKEGKEKTEISTWEHDSVYEYATRPGKKCEFYLVPSSDTKLVSQDVY